MKNNNLHNFNFNIKTEDRSKILNHKPLLIWFTGLSGSGKSTVSNALEKRLNKESFLTYSLDGDNTRNGLSSDLTFSSSDRKENIRRIAEVCKILLNAGLIVNASFISPRKEMRDMVKDIVGRDYFFEVFISTPLEECEKRDVKGLYKKAREGKIPNFTGIDSDFDKPLNPDIIIDTSKYELQKSVNIIYELIKNKISIDG